MLQHGEVNNRKKRDDGGEASVIELSGSHVSALERTVRHELTGTFNLNGRDIDTGNVAELCEFLCNRDDTAAPEVEYGVALLQIGRKNVEPSEVAAVARE